MNLRTRVIIISLFQALIDVTGIITALNFEKLVKLTNLSSLHENKQDFYLQHEQQNFSYVENVNILYYTLPYVFSGVIPRMLNGFECLTADQLVKQNVKEWNQVVRMKFDLNFIKYNYSVKEEYWNSVLNETENILVKSLARRKKKCNRRTYVLSGLRLKQNMTDEQYLEDFEKRHCNDLKILY